jgi:hypothetical protein
MKFAADDPHEFLLQVETQGRVNGGVQLGNLDIGRPFQSRFAIENKWSLQFSSCNRSRRP